MRGFAYFLIGFLVSFTAILSTSANAGYALPAPPQGFSVTSQGYMYRAPLGVTAANGTYATSVSVNVAGRAVTVPASMRLAANSPRFAVGLMRSHPYLFVGTVAAAYMASRYGFTLTSEGGMSNTPPQLGYVPIDDVENRAGIWRQASQTESECRSFAAECSHNRALADARQIVSSRSDFASMGAVVFGSESSTTQYYNKTTSGTGSITLSRSSGTANVCPGNYTLNGGLCVPASTASVPMTEEQWNTVRDTWPSDDEGLEALDDVVRQFPLPIVPTLPETVTAPLGNPYPDPVTGQPYQDMVRITPDPAPDAPFRVRVDPYRQPTTSLDPAAPPDTSPGSPPVENIDVPPSYHLDYQDSDFPPVTSFYEPIYPDGLQGVWNTHKANIDATPFVSMVGQLTSGAPQSGTCPSWSFDASALGLGSHNLAPPCEVWPWIKWIVLITAAFAARAIIFGG